MITGKDIIELGIEPGPHIPQMIKIAQSMGPDASPNEIMDAIAHLMPAPKLKLTHGRDYFCNIRAENEAEQANLDAVHATMAELMRTPVLRAGAIMPDACPAGGVGTIPVGGVAASQAIHPGMHSADICCSLSLSVFQDAPPKTILDAVHKVTHFGPGGRKEFGMSSELQQKAEENSFLAEFIETGHSHMGTQGDGNHFAYVGTLKSTGETALVTHHGSRGFGAKLYKKAMKIADKFRLKLSPETLKANAWIPSDTQEGEDYWAALQIARAWTKENHQTIHRAASELSGHAISDQFWNEHNFVFRKSDGLFYHGKGATPAFNGWAEDATDLTIVPLNMAEPILIVRGNDADNGLGFSPHGAGRNFSRSQHKRLNEQRAVADVFAEETKNIDARFFSGVTDISELPSAYKSAAAVRAQIAEFGLADVVDEVIPYGCIMAGDWEQNAPWRK